MRVLLLAGALLSLAACNLPPQPPQRIISCGPYEEVRGDVCFPKH